jgi:hypothetical protein
MGTCTEAQSKNDNKSHVFESDFALGLMTSSRFHQRQTVQTPTNCRLCKNSLLYGCPYPSLNVRVRGTAVRNPLCQARFFSPCFGFAPETHLSTFRTVLCSSMPPLPVIHEAVLLSVP